MAPNRKRGLALAVLALFIGLVEAACEDSKVNRDPGPGSSTWTGTGTGTGAPGGSGAGGGGGGSVGGQGPGGAPPSQGDDCTNPIELDVGSGMVSGGLRNYAWYVVRPSIAGCYRITSDGGIGVTQHYVYESAACDPLGPELWMSESSYSDVESGGYLEAGIDYLLRVWSNTSQPSVRVEVGSDQGGCACQLPYDVSAATFPVALSGEFPCEAHPEVPCVSYDATWFSYVPAHSGSFLITATSDSNRPGQLAVFDGSGCNPYGQQLACVVGQDATTSTIIDLEAGASYLVVYSQDDYLGTTVNPVLSIEEAVSAYSEGFDGACPAGWSLTGDWQCGTPSVVGPTGAYSGAQCLGTVLDGSYSNGQNATATSPAIDLSGMTAVRASWRGWIHTTGWSDRCKLWVSVDDGATWQVVSDQYVTPDYDSYDGWSGDHEAEGWRPMTADLSSWAGQSIELRFVFGSDDAGTDPGVYLDDVVVLGG